MGINGHRLVHGSFYDKVYNDFFSQKWLEQETVLYFAYGSNLSLHRIRIRLGNYQKVTNHVIQDYELVFNIGDLHSYANIIPKKGKEVEGVIYRIPKKELTYLDRYEAVPVNYIRQRFMYEDEECHLYMGVKKTKAYPTLEYLQIIQTGCVEHRLVKTYNKINDYIIKNIEKIQL